MSVAFRRESDEEHLEPRFELPIPPGPNLVTARGLRLIERRVAELEAARRETADEEAVKAIARDLRYWRSRSASAEVTTPASGDVVAFGSSVRVRMDGRERILAIVGHDEAGTNGRVAFSAPVARALMGATVGDSVDVAGRTELIEVLGLSCLDKPDCP